MTCTFVSLSDDAFRKALDRYIDEEKPDPLMKKQMEGWSFYWTDDDVDQNSNDNYNDISTSATPGESFDKKIAGTLLWKGEYLEIAIHCTCCWKGTEQGSLSFSCHILKARLVAGHEAESEKTAPNNNNNNTKIHKRMHKRLETDDYISKYLLFSQKQQQSKNELFCQANIRFSENVLEERVHCSEHVAEAIRRAIFTTAESTLDVFDLFVHLPCLPCTVHAGGGDDDDDITSTTTALANRAKLRLLEDAMYDACEKEEEEELVKDLKIDPRKKQKPSSS